MTFAERIASSLKLTLGGSTIEVEPRQIASFSAALRPWGFTAEVRFRYVCRSSPDEDVFFEAFLKPDPCEAHLELGRTFEEVGETTRKLVLKGLVIHREIEETDEQDIAGAPVMTRHYTVHIRDRAQAAWSRHRPTMLFVDSTYKALFDANLVASIALAHDWPGSSVQHPVLSLGLGMDENAASFHDFIVWFAHREGLGLFYDPDKDSYKLQATKPPATGPVPLEAAEVAALEVRFPPVRRAKVAVLNGSTLAAESKKEVTNQQAATGVKADFLVRTAIASQHDARTTIETNRAKQRLPGLRIELGSFPAQPPILNKGLELSDGFSPAIFAHGKSFRVTAFDLQGKEELEEQGGVDAEAGRRYEISATFDLEQASDPAFHLPPFVAPVWPFYAEGKVVSEVGASDEETYQVYQEQGTSIDTYKVQVPLFDDKKVIVRYEPMTLNGQFYFPAYKGERLLLALHLDRAEMASYLDWRPGGRLPLDLQGNHILLGKKAASQTSVSHTYLDAKPVLKILRTQGKDEQSIVIKDGTLTMTTLEND